MHEILLASVVCCDHSCSVVGILSLQHTVSSEPVIFQGEVEAWSDVLGREYLDIGFFLLLVREQGAPVGEFSVRSLCVVLREIVSRVAVHLIWCVEYRVVLFLSFEIIVELGRGADHSKV